MFSFIAVGSRNPISSQGTPRVPSIRESLLLGVLKRLGADRHADAEYLAGRVAAMVDNLKATEASSWTLDL
jgi:hypothetical protein